MNRRNFLKTAVSALGISTVSPIPSRNTVGGVSLGVVGYDGVLQIRGGTVEFAYTPIKIDKDGNRSAIPHYLFSGVRIVDSDKVDSANLETYLFTNRQCWVSMTKPVLAKTQCVIRKSVYHDDTKRWDLTLGEIT